ncbi:MAG: carbohydrate porin [Myxococcota bacterium]
MSLRSRAGRVAGLALGVAATALPAGAEARLLGDPGGARSDLERRGVTLQAFSNHFATWKVAGGADSSGELGHSGSYDLFALLDAERLVGAPGLSVLLHVKGQYDENVNPDVGALADPIDDADFDRAVYVTELWLEQALLANRVRLRVGFLEQQTLFDRNAYANSEDRQFLATALDNNPVVPLPNGLGAALMLHPTDALELALGVGDAENVPGRSGFDTAFDGHDSLGAWAETTLRVRPCGLPGSYRLGVFRDGRDDGHWGAYLSFDQLLLQEADAPDEGLGVFARFGKADEDESRISWSWSAGLSYAGALPGRSDDVLGLGVWQLSPSSRGADVARETGAELYYAAAVLPWLTVTPAVQWIRDPGGEPTPDAVVTTLRMRVAF